MEKYIDLHCHSWYSGGEHGCPALIKLARQNGIAVLSLTDHNVISGLNEMSRLAAKTGIKFIAGVEIYTYFRDKHLHILGYNFDPNNIIIVRALSALAADNKNKLTKAAKGLQKSGYKINLAEILKGPATNYGVLHIIKELEKYPENMKLMAAALPPDKRGFFDRVEFFCGAGRPGHLPLSELPAEEAIKIIKQSGGFTCLAHPGQQLFYQHDEMIRELVRKGLDGLEILSPYHSWHHVEHYQNFCLDNNLLMTGGSDYHGDINFSKKELIGRQWDYFHVPYRFYERLKKSLPNL